MRPHGRVRLWVCRVREGNYYDRLAVEAFAVLDAAENAMITSVLRRKDRSTWSPRHAHEPPPYASLALYIERTRGQ